MSLVRSKEVILKSAHRTAHANRQAVNTANSLMKNEPFVIFLIESVPMHILPQNFKKYSLYANKISSVFRRRRAGHFDGEKPDRKSTRLNSSHLVISYAVFCLKKKN